MAKQKSYNPFKMWGSYAGVFLYPLSVLILIYAGEMADWLENIVHYPGLLITKGLVGIVEAIFGNGLVDISQPGMIFWMLAFVIGYAGTGFVIGWAIHSLFRRFSK